MITNRRTISFQVGLAPLDVSRGLLSNGVEGVEDRENGQQEQANGDDFGVDGLCHSVYRFEVQGSRFKVRGSRFKVLVFHFIL